MLIPFFVYVTEHYIFFTLMSLLRPRSRQKFTKTKQKKDISNSGTRSHNCCHCACDHTCTYVQRLTHVCILYHTHSFVSWWHTIANNTLQYKHIHEWILQVCIHSHMSQSVQMNFLFNIKNEFNKRKEKEKKKTNWQINNIIFFFSYLTSIVVVGTLYLQNNQELKPEFCKVKLGRKLEKQWSNFHKKVFFLSFFFCCMTPKLLFIN